MTSVLGISAYYHDSAAALVVDGEIVAAAQEERFTRIKHDHAFPTNAIAYCLEEAGIGPGDLDFVGFYDKPFLKFERILETYLAFAPAGFRSFLKAMPLWMRQKLHLPREIRRELQGDYRRGIVFTEHHESHAASAFFPVAFRRGRDPDPRRGGGVGHRQLRCRPRQSDRAQPRAAVSPLARTVVLGLHLLLRFQGQLRRVQAHGSRALRFADLRRRDPRQAARPQGRRLVPARPQLLQLLPGSDDDVEEVRPPVRGPAADARDTPDPARDGPCGFGAEGHRRDRPADGCATSTRRPG